jgi:hypothetical protein
MTINENYERRTVQCIFPASSDTVPLVKLLSASLYSNYGTTYHLRLPAGSTGKARKSGEPAPGAQVPKCGTVQILLRSTRLNPAERFRPQPKPCGFGHLRLPAGFTGTARKSGEPAPGAQVPKCGTVQVLLRSTRRNAAERCRPQPKPCGFGHLRLPAGSTGKARKSGEPAQHILMYTRTHIFLHAHIYFYTVFLLFIVLA